MRDPEQTLARLAMGFTVQDIMVPKESLVYGRDEDSARKLLEERRDLDVIPIEQGGELVAYLQRGGKKQKGIRIKDVIGAGTSILDLVEVLEGSCSEGRGFCFVLVRNRIAGYVHYSDLNNDIVKLPFFILFENVEHHLVGELRPLIHEDNLADILVDKDRLNHAKEKMSFMREHGTDLDWTTVLYFRELLNFASRFGLLPSEVGKAIDDLSNVRNKVCHATGPLVDAPRDAGKLSTAKMACMAILQSS